MLHLVWIGALAACSGARAPEPVAPGSLRGEQLAPPIVVPEFAAVSHDGAPRSRADLLGHPTVMWFFPAAGTPG